VSNKFKWSIDVDTYFLEVSNLNTVHSFTWIEIVQDTMVNLQVLLNKVQADTVEAEEIINNTSMLTPANKAYWKAFYASRHIKQKQE